MPRDAPVTMAARRGDVAAGNLLVFMMISLMSMAATSSGSLAMEIMISIDLLWINKVKLRCKFKDRQQ
ncbi:hypothetical protein D3C77_818170 [compost metagenome]